MRAVTVHGRARERGRIATLLDDVTHGRSGALLLEGPAGIGKTALLEEALRQASASGVRVLAARAYEAEADIPYAALLDLLAPVIDLRARLPEGQRRALEGALAIEPAPAPGDRYAVPVAVLGLLGLVAEEGPLLVAVDDGHWLDPASREAVLFVAQRLVAEGVGLLLAARDADGAPIDAADLEPLRLGPLDRDSALAVLAQDAALAPEVADALVRASAGVPLALHELPRGLTAEQRSGRAPLHEPPAPGEEVQAAFARQLGALPAATRRALCVAGAVDGAPQETLHAALERMDVPRAALAVAFDREVVAVRDGRVAFRHPLLASAAYHASTSGERRAAHAALAAVAADVAHRAWHLSAAAVGPDREAAAALEAAARDARRRGAHAEAARAFGRAAELSPGTDEQLARELEAARDHAIAGHGERALELAARVESRAGDAALRSGAKQVRAHLQMRGGAPMESMRALEELAAEALAAGDQAASARLLLEASLGHMFGGDMRALFAVADRARVRAEGVADDLALLAVLVTGEALLALGRSAEGDALVAAAEPLLFAADPLSEISEVVGMGAMTSLWVERFERVERIVGRMVEVTREAGAAARLTYPLAVRSQLQWRRGRWAAAYADAEESVSLARGTGQVGTLALSLAMLARSEGGIGRVDEARAHGEEGVALSETAAGDATVMHSLAALGFAELSAGRAAEAAAWLDRADETDRRLGHGEPALTMYAADHVEALLRAGRRADAERALARLAEGAQRTGGTWAAAATERGRAMLADDDEAAIAHATAALRAHERVEMPFERGRTELVLGERLRRARRRADARAPLEAALAAFERIGAEPWAQRARTELQATGARAGAHVAGPVERLTPHELQVALLVAEGRTNREVGAALFLSPKTIEHHLSAIYRKLDLRSRAQLAAALAGELEPAGSGARHYGSIGSPGSPGRTTPAS